MIYKVTPGGIYTCVCVCVCVYIYMFLCVCVYTHTPCKQIKGDRLWRTNCEVSEIFFQTNELACHGFTGAGTRHEISESETKGL